MKLIPPFKEQFSVDYENDFASISKNMNALSDSDVEFIVSYLSSCTVVEEWLSAVPDPIDRSVKVPNRSWTDGTYYWDEMLIHFIRSYKIKLPKDFVEHIKKKSSQERPSLDLEEIKLTISKSLRAARVRDMSVYDLS
jgi:hypothetical protein